MGAAFKSKAQMERCRRLVAEGTVTQDYFDECLALTPTPDALPERLHPKKEPKKKESEPDFG